MKNVTIETLTDQLIQMSRDVNQNCTNTKNENTHHTAHITHNAYNMRHKYNIQNEY